MIYLQNFKVSKVKFAWNFTFTYPFLLYVNDLEKKMFWKSEVQIARVNGMKPKNYITQFFWRFT